ncbi:unnamed protein product [Lota lota]
MTVGGASKPNRTSEILKGQCVGQQRPQAGHRRNSCSSSTIRPTPLTLCHPEKRLLLKFTQVGVLSSSGADHDVITNTLFQLEETKGGAVQIDDVDLSGVGLRELRSGLAIIPKLSVSLSRSLCLSLSGCWCQRECALLRLTALPLFSRRVHCSPSCRWWPQHAADPKQA